MFRAHAPMSMKWIATRLHIRRQGYLSHLFLCQKVVSISGRDPFSTAKDDVANPWVSVPGHRKRHCGKGVRLTVGEVVLFLVTKHLLGNDSGSDGSASHGGGVGGGAVAASL